MSIPPKITVNEFNELAFKPGEKVELRCDASGDPKPTYVFARAAFHNSDLVLKYSREFLS